MLCILSDLQLIFGRGDPYMVKEICLVQKNFVQIITVSE
jgi:hypothetical protein